MVMNVHFNNYNWTTVKYIILIDAKFLGRNVTNKGNSFKLLRVPTEHLVN